MTHLFPPATAHWRLYHDALVEHVRGLGAVTVLPKQSQVGLAAGAQFAVLQPATPERFDVGLKLPGVEPTKRLAPAGRWGGTMTHRVRVPAPGDPDPELLGWMREAYAASLGRRKDD